MSINNKIFFIAEIGINHDGSLKKAKDLIDAAALAKVHSVKFQYRNLKRIYSDNKKEIGDEILSSEIKKNYLSVQDIVSLTTYAHSLHLQVGISFFITDDFYDFKKEVNNFDFFKIPSVELQNFKLIKLLIDTKKQVYISTGAHKEKEIDNVFNFFKEHKNWMPLHCVSNYPVASFNSNLGYIRYLKKKWGRDVGYSSHDSNFTICNTAMDMGAKVIERHITFDKASSGLDHTSSSTANEFKLLIDYANYREMIISGNRPRKINQGELINRQNLGRSLFYIKNFKAGERITLDHLDYRVPAVGISINKCQDLLGKATIKNVRKGDPLSIYDFKIRKDISRNYIDLINKFNISLPVRFHDYQDVSSIFKINKFEFHLSYSELYSNFEKFSFDNKNDFSIHLPDYVSSTELFNPFSRNNEIKNKSIIILNKAASLAKKLSNGINKKIILVSSLSNLENFPKAIFYKKCKKLQEKYTNKQSLLTYQLLPPFAWYFGGNVPIDSFSSLDDIDFLLINDIKITLDLSHLIMSSNFHNFEIQSTIKKLLKITEHFHLSLASGFDSEGEGFSKMNDEMKMIVKQILTQKKHKVIEVWQGHLNNYEGFYRALNDLGKLYYE